MNKFQEAGSEFKLVLEKILRDDSYSFLGLADIAFRNAIDSKGASDQDKLLIKAYGKYLEILSHDQQNQFACLGIANVLAYFNKVDDAVEIYKLISQTNPSVHQAIMNQAHLSVGCRMFELAINLYQIVLEKHKPNDLKTEMFLAKAYFLQGDYEASKKITLKLVARYPSNLSLRFNLALCLYEQAYKITNQEIRKSYQTIEAIGYLRQAQKLFNFV